MLIETVDGLKTLMGQEKDGTLPPLYAGPSQLECEQEVIARKSDGMLNLIFEEPTGGYKVWHLSR